MDSSPAFRSCARPGSPATAGCCSPGPRGRARPECAASSRPSSTNRSRSSSATRRPCRSDRGSVPRARAPRARPRRDGGPRPRRRASPRRLACSGRVPARARRRHDAARRRRDRRHDQRSGRDRRGRAPGPDASTGSCTWARPTARRGPRSCAATCARWDATWTSIASPRRPRAAQEPTCGSSSREPCCASRGGRRGEAASVTTELLLELARESAGGRSPGQYL